jgi:Flp pilus assembly protein TadG
MSEFSNKATLKHNKGNVFKRFLRNSAGSLAPTAALSAIPFMIAAGAAMEMSRVGREQVAFYGAVDGAALAIAADDRSALELLDSQAEKEEMRVELEQYAERYIGENYASRLGSDSSVDVNLAINGSEIKLDATVNLEVSILGLTNGNNIELNANSTIKKAMKPIELTMVLDTTGSMRNDMSGLKTAAKKLLTTLYGGTATSSEYIRVSLVPFSGAVRLDTNAYDFEASWIDTAGTNPLSKVNFNDTTWNNHAAWGKLKANSTTPLQWNGCVESRRTGSGTTTNYITTDVAPAVTDIHSTFPAYFNPDSPTYYTSNVNNYPSGGSSVTGSWNNNYIFSYSNYTTSLSGQQSSLLAPSGSRQKGYDDSTIGNYNTSNMDVRWKNVAKYDGKVIGTESLTLQGDGVTWSSNAGPWVNCTASKVVPMTYNRSKVVAGIDSMKAYGGTNIAEGLAWGMRVISPSEPFTLVEGVGGIANSTIAPYNGPRWQKILVLMTDGENDPYVRNQYGSPVVRTDTGTSYNSFGAVTTPTTLGLNRYGSTSFNNADDTLNSYTLSICSKLKESGVTIYAVNFKVDNAMMQSCATSPEHYKRANNAVELSAFFDHIGQDVLNKMIYVSK